MREFDVENRAEGDVGLLTITMPLPGAHCAPGGLEWLERSQSWLQPKSLEIKPEPASNAPSPNLASTPPATAAAIHPSVRLAARP